MDEHEFRDKADAALHELDTRLTALSEDYPIEADMSAGAMVIGFEDSSTKFVISPNTPVRQIWVSAHSKSYKLDWNSSSNEFVLQLSGKSLTQLISDAISQQLGEPVSL